MKRLAIIVFAGLLAVGCGGESMPSAPEASGGVLAVPDSSGGTPAIATGGGGQGPAPTLGGACTAVGEMGCAEAKASQRLVCSSDLFWIDNGECEGETVCAAHDASRRGECILPEPLCAGRAGEVFCHDGAPLTCAADETATVQACADCGCPEGDACPASDFVRCSSDCEGGERCLRGLLL